MSTAAHRGRARRVVTMSARLRPPSAVETPVRAGQRDASFYNKPGWSGKYHVIAGHDDDRERDIAACSPYRPVPVGETGHVWPRMALVPESAVPATEVPQHQRCGRPGCRQRWAEVAK